MFTFLRKIKKSLIDSNSTRKYLLYAMGEILLVMIGILLALQVNNWNEWRKDRVVERKVLEDLRDNIIRNNDLIQTALTTIAEYSRSTDIVRNVIRSNLSYSDTLDFHFSRSIRHGGFLLRLNTDGYESLKNIGFGIIQNEGLKDQILNLFEVSYNNFNIELQWGNSVYTGHYGWWSDYFYQSENDTFIPIDFTSLHENKSLLSELNVLAGVRHGLQREIEKCLLHNNEVLNMILAELQN